MAAVFDGGGDLRGRSGVVLLDPLQDWIMNEHAQNALGVMLRQEVSSDEEAQSDYAHHLIATEMPSGIQSLSSKLSAPVDS